MLERSGRLETTLRPHVKTHKTVEGALMQTMGQRSTITCSTLAEAEFFAAAGFTDIVYAVPIDPFKLERAAKLAEHVHVTIDNVQQLDELISYGPPSPGTKWSVVIMVDSGYGRDGVDVDDPDSISLAQKLAASASADLFMLYTHGGHSYDVPPGDVEAIRRISEAERDAVVSFKAKVRARGGARLRIEKGS